MTSITVTGTDIGSKNYSWCTVTHVPGEHVYHPLFPKVALPKIKIEGWKLLNLAGSDNSHLPEHVTRNLHAYMVEDDKWRDCLAMSTRVVIEKQLDALMLHSQKMLQISMALLMAILKSNKTAVFESSKRRLTVFADIIPLLPKKSKAKDQHAQNKIISKQLCEMLLVANSINPATTEYSKHAKNDDLADSFLLAVVSAWLGTYHAEAVEETPVTYKNNNKRKKKNEDEKTEKNEKTELKKSKFEAVSTLKRPRTFKNYVVRDIKNLGDKGRVVKKNQIVLKSDF